MCSISCWERCCVHQPLFIGNPQHIKTHCTYFHGTYIAHKDSIWNAYFYSFYCIFFFFQIVFLFFATYFPLFQLCYLWISPKGECQYRNIWSCLMEMFTCSSNYSELHENRIVWHPFCHVWLFSSCVTEYYSDYTWVGSPSLRPSMTPNVVWVTGSQMCPQCVLEMFTPLLETVH